MERYLERSYDMTMRRIVLPVEDDLKVPDPVGATALEIEEKEGEDFDDKEQPEN